MSSRTLFLLFLIQATAYASTADSSITDKAQIFRLGLTEIAGGADFRIHVLRPVMNSELYQYSGYSGVFSRVQTAFLGSLIDNKKWFKRWILCDYEVGEVSAGYSHTPTPHLIRGVYALYNFELGIVFRYYWHHKSDFWLNISFLQFAKDYFSDFFGGSNYRMRLRYDRVVFEISWISENKFYFGAFNFISRDNNIPKFAAAVKYFIKPHTFLGVHLSSLPAFESYESKIGREQVYTIHCMLGITF